jgi:two-component system nitrate/nitrite response regulator NarL
MKTLTVANSHHQQDRLPDDNPTSHGRLLVVQGHALLGDGLKLALSERSWDVETTCGPTPTDVSEAAQRFRAQCALLDVHLHHADGAGIDLIAPLVSAGAQVVILTAERRRAVLAECLEAGAAGWVSLDAGLGELDVALQRALAGQPIIGQNQRAEYLGLLRSQRAAARTVSATFEQLTPREVLVLSALTDGLTADEIAKAHFVAVTTVRSQIRSLLQKLGVRSQLAAVAIADAHRDQLPQEMTSETGRRRSDPNGSGATHTQPARTA